MTTRHMNNNILDEHLINDNLERKFHKRPIFIWLTLLIFGILFKVMLWPGSTILIITSTAGLQAYCLNGILKSNGRNTLNITLSILGSIWFIIMVGGMLFNHGHPYNKNGVGFYFVVLVIYFFIYFLLLNRKKASSRPK